MNEETLKRQFELDMKNFNHRDSYTNDMAHWLEEYNNSDEKPGTCGYSYKFICARNLQTAISRRAIAVRRKGNKMNE
jgi:hypothetical protein